MFNCVRKVRSVLDFLYLLIDVLVSRGDFIYSIVGLNMNKRQSSDFYIFNFVVIF